MIRETAINQMKNIPEKVQITFKSNRMSIFYLYFYIKCQNADSVHLGSRPPTIKGLYIKNFFARARVPRYNVKLHFQITFKQIRLPPSFNYGYLQWQTRIDNGCLIISPVPYVYSELSQPSAPQTCRYLKCQNKSHGGCVTPIA